MKNEVQFILAPGVALGDNHDRWDVLYSLRVAALRQKFQKLLRPRGRENHKHNTR